MKLLATTRYRLQVLSLATALAALPVFADTHTWVGFSGNWSDSNNWSPVGPVATTDNTSLIFTDAISRAISLDATTTVGSITLNAPGPDLLVFSQSANVFTPGLVTLGTTGCASYFQSGGSFTCPNSIYLGYSATGVGSYSLSGGQLTVSGTNYSTEYVGYSGTGNFNQTGGTNSPAWYLHLGENSGSVGNYTLSGGYLKVSAFFNVGVSGTGNFNQTGGTNSLPSTFYLGTSLGSVGNYTLSNGLLSAYIEQFGNSGTGIFTQSGGTHTTDYLYLGAVAGVSGRFVLSDGTYTVNNTASIYTGGTFTQTGGTHRIKTLLLGTQSEYSHTGGTLNMWGGLVNNGKYTLGGTATIQVSCLFNMSSMSISDVSQVTVKGESGALIILPAGITTDKFKSFINDGITTAAGSTVTIPSGKSIFAMAGSCNEFINCAGVFYGTEYEAADLNGGIMVQGWGGQATVGNLTADNASSGITGGSLTVNGGMYVGRYASGSFAQSGGKHACNRINVGMNGNTGSYIQSDGTLSAFSASFVGTSGTGNYVQSGGTHSTGDLYIGSGSSAVGSYTLSNGWAKASRSEYIGYSGRGSFTQNGGTNGATQTIYLGYSLSSTGTYVLAGGYLGTSTLSLGSYDNYVQGGTGTFTMTGGTTGIYNLQVWRNTGRVELSGGTLSVTGSLNMGPGTFNQTGGSLSCVSFSSTGAVSFGGTQSLYSFTQAYFGSAALASGGTRLMKISSFSLTTNGKLDLTDNKLIIQSSNTTSDYSNLKTWIGNARNGGKWDGTTGMRLTSSLATNTGTELTGLALARASDLGMTTFGGQSVNGNSLLVKYTYVGDADLDGKITMDDYLAIDSGYLFGGTTYIKGDFNYDGVVTGADYQLIDYAFLHQGGRLNEEAWGMVGLHAGWFGEEYGEALGLGGVNVPEVGTVGLLGVGLLGLGRKLLTVR